MERGRCSGQGLLASAPDSSPMAEHAFCRQSPAVGAPCPSGLAGIRVGALGNRRSYRNPVNGP